MRDVIRKPGGVKFVVYGGDFFQRVGRKKPDGLVAAAHVFEDDVERTAAGLDDAGQFLGGREIVVEVALRLVAELFEVGGQALIEHDAELRRRALRDRRLW